MEEINPIKSPGFLLLIFWNGFRHQLAVSCYVSEATIFTMTIFIAALELDWCPLSLYSFVHAKAVTFLRFREVNRLPPHATFLFTSSDSC